MYWGRSAATPRGTRATFKRRAPPSGEESRRSNGGSIKACRPKPTPKANSGPQKVRPGSRLAAHGPLSVSGDAKGISPIIAERLSPNRMPSLRRRCCSWTLVRDGGHWVRLSRHGVRHRVGDEATPVALRQGSLRVGQRADPHPPGDIRDTENGTPMRMRIAQQGHFRDEGRYRRRSRADPLFEVY